MYHPDILDMPEISGIMWAKGILKMLAKGDKKWSRKYPIVG
ncbi:hypothetical protein LCGC14_2919610, partial [marine sediment metagenome]